jgi:AcrR family transcriptional regulator
MAQLMPSERPIRRKFRGLAPEERQEQRRARLLEAGIEAFGTHGFHAVGVRDICARAQLTERYFYESFKNREALFLAVYQALGTRMEQTVGNALAGSSPEQLARTSLRAMLEAFRADPRMARILLIEVLSVGAGETPLAISQGFADMIEQICLGLYPELARTKLDARLVANGLYGSTIYVAMRWTLDGFKEPLEQILDHCALFYEAVAVKMDGLAPEPPARGRDPEPKTAPVRPAPARRTRRNA